MTYLLSRRQFLAIGFCMFLLQVGVVLETLYGTTNGFVETNPVFQRLDWRIENFLFLGLFVLTTTLVFLFYMKDHAKYRAVSVASDLLLIALLVTRIVDFTCNVLTITGVLMI